MQPKTATNMPTFKNSGAQSLFQELGETLAKINLKATVAIWDAAYQKSDFLKFMDVEILIAKGMRSEI